LEKVLESCCDGESCGWGGTKRKKGAKSKYDERTKRRVKKWNNVQIEPNAAG